MQSRRCCMLLNIEQHVVCVYPSLCSQYLDTLDCLLQAYVWVKPPGESDGSSQATTPGNVPDAEGKRFDPSCDPNDPSKVMTVGFDSEDRRVCRTHKRRT
jgi:Glycosyl hydrolases family 6